METLQVALGRRSYPIYIGGGLLEQAEELLRPLGVGRWAIVCDDTVAALYGAPLARRTGWQFTTHHTDSPAPAALLWLYHALGQVR